jgi:hypothetical protein
VNGRQVLLSRAKPNNGGFVRGTRRVRQLICEADDPVDYAVLLEAA